MKKKKIMGMFSAIMLLVAISSSNIAVNAATYCDGGNHHMVNSCNGNNYTSYLGYHNYTLPCNCRVGCPGAEYSHSVNQENHSTKKDCYYCDYLSYSSHTAVYSHSSSCGGSNYHSY